MSKLKTRKAAAKRFKVSGTGKLLRGRQMGRHLRRKKSASNLRRKRTAAVMEGAFAKKLKAMIGE